MLNEPAKAEWTENNRPKIRDILKENLNSVVFINTIYKKIKLFVNIVRNSNALKISIKTLIRSLILEQCL